MIIAVGALVGIVAVGGYDRYSRYSEYDDHDNYSRYSDSYLVQQVESAKAKSNQAKRNLAQAEEALRAEYQNGLERLKEKYGDIPIGSSNAQDFLREKEQLLLSMKSRMKEDLQEAQKEVDDINAAIQKINSMQLKK